MDAGLWDCRTRPPVDLGVVLIQGRDRLEDSLVHDRLGINKRTGPLYFLRPEYGLTVNWSCQPTLGITNVQPCLAVSHTSRVTTLSGTGTRLSIQL